MLQVWHKNKGNDWKPKEMKLKGSGDEIEFNIPEGTKIKYDEVETFFPKTAADQLGTYKVSVKTGDSSGAGTDAKVRINLLGSKGQTRLRPLDTKYSNDFEAGSLGSYDLVCADIGDIKGNH